jgi:organic hydroperoxide reductase OsmC/OhrA
LIAVCAVLRRHDHASEALDRNVLDLADMPAPFPHVYSATVSRTFASRARVLALPHPDGPLSLGEGPMALDGGPSRHLDGDTASWSPEHLVLSSLGICMLTTFEAFAARDGIELLKWDASVSGTVERTPEGLMFTSIVLGIDMEIAGRVERVESTLEDAKQYCLVLNSLRVPVVIETQIHTPDDDRTALPYGAPSYVAEDARHAS